MTWENRKWKEKHTQFKLLESIFMMNSSIRFDKNDKPFLEISTWEGIHRICVSTHCAWKRLDISFHLLHHSTVPVKRQWSSLAHTQGTEMDRQHEVYQVHLFNVEILLKNGILGTYLCIYCVAAMPPYPIKIASWTSRKVSPFLMNFIPSPYKKEWWCYRQSLMVCMSLWSTSVSI